MDEAPRAAPGAAVSPDLTAEQRKRTLLVRVHTFSDAFRLLRFLGISDEQREQATHLLKAFRDVAEEGVQAPEGRTALKHPEHFIEAASTERLEDLEGVASEIEDLLLALDDDIADDTFAARVKRENHAQVVLARYARLLASRDVPAGQRHDRFAWLAMHLLTSHDDSGKLVMLPKAEARAVLQQIIGGMTRHADAHELREAIAYLEDSTARVQALKGHEALFESGYFRDMHRRRVAMRELLFNPDFLYVSAALSAALDNRIEGWIRALQYSVRSAEGTWREHIDGLLREQVDAVDHSFGVKRRASAEASAAGLRRAASMVEAARTADAEAPAEQASSERPPFMGWDGQTVAIISVAVLLFASLGSLLWTTGVVGGPQVEALDDGQLRALSPVLNRGWLYDSGKDRYLEAQIAQHAWDALDRAARNEAAEKLRAELAAIEVSKALVNAGDARAIEISGGKVVHVQER